MLKTLVVEDNRVVLAAIRSLCELLEMRNVQYFTEGKDFIKSFSKCTKIAIIDFYLPDIDGISILKEAVIVNPDCYFIMLSGEDSKTIVIEALNSGAWRYVSKDEQGWLDRLQEYLKEAIVRVKEERETKKEKILKSLEKRAAIRSLEKRLKDFDENI